MGNFRKDAKIAAVIVLAALIVSQAFRINKSNPPVHAGLSAKTPVNLLLRNACYDCHSNETVWPWYSNVAPVSWLLASDVSEGRRELNFSEWGTYGTEKQLHRLEAIAEEMQEGDMPPWYYSIMHADSRLKSEQRDQIRNWSLSARKMLSKE
jgi:hypothetical protein